MLDVGAKKLAEQMASVLLEMGLDKGIAGAGKGISKAARVVPEIVTHKLKRAGGGNAEIAVRGQNPEVNPHANGEIPNNAQAGVNGNGNAQNGLNNAKIDDPDLLPPGKGRRSGARIEPDVEIDAHGRIASSRAEITTENINGGTGTTNAARDYARPDDAGHIIAKLLGGRGGKNSKNIFAQNPKINRGKYRDFEGWIARQVRDGHHVEVFIELNYKGSSTRPNKIIYHVFVDGVERVEKFSN